MQLFPRYRFTFTAVGIIAISGVDFVYPTLRNFAPFDSASPFPQKKMQADTYFGLFYYCKVALHLELLFDLQTNSENKSIKQLI